jgi:hypothetical protein
MNQIKYTGQPISIGDIFTESWTTDIGTEYVYHYKVLRFDSEMVFTRVTESNRESQVGSNTNFRVSQLIKWFDESHHDWIWSRAPKPFDMDEELFKI